MRTENHISEAEKISRRTEGRTEGDWEKLVGAVGIELKAMLKTRKLLISLNAKNARGVINFLAHSSIPAVVSSICGRAP